MNDDAEMPGQMADEPQAQFAIGKIYLKDLSFESPASPGVFALEANPDIDINLGASSTALDAENHEVVVTVTITARQQDDQQNLFLVEVQQAGIFRLLNVPREQMAAVLAVTCPNLLFPYVRQIISEMTVAGGFPPLLLQPVNFEALYQQHLAQQGGAEPSVTH